MLESGTVRKAHTRTGSCTYAWYRPAGTSCPIHGAEKIVKNTKKISAHLQAPSVSKFFLRNGLILVPFSLLQHKYGNSPKWTSKEAAGAAVSESAAGAGDSGRGDSGPRKLAGEDRMRGCRAKKGMVRQLILLPSRARRHSSHAIGNTGRPRC